MGKAKDTGNPESRSTQVEAKAKASGAEKAPTSSKSRDGSREQVPPLDPGHINQVASPYPLHLPPSIYLIPQSHDQKPQIPGQLSKDLEDKEAKAHSCQWQ